MTKNEEFQKLVEDMSLTPSMLTAMAGVNRSTLHGYQTGKSSPTALSLAYMKLLKFVYERDRQMFLDYLILSEFDQVEEGTSDPRIAAIYKKGKLPKDLDQYLKNFIDE